MARPLLVPTAFATLLGLHPGCFALHAGEPAGATPAPVSPAEPAGAPAVAGEPTEPAPAEPAAAPGASSTPPGPPSPADLTVVTTARTGNARAPSYDGDVIVGKGAPAQGVAIVTVVSEAR